ncbi:DUF1735 domain-containing protein [Pedobacter hiemivivus]|nr:DUF1735 domain-containing protein [Pedobacter hiemivivus]
MKTYILMLLTACLFTSCLKTDDGILDYRGIEPLVINPKANFPSKAIFAAPAVDSAFGVTRLNLTAKYSFQKPAPRDLKVTFTRDDALIAQYNLANGTNYLPLPADSYEMSGTQVVIEAGTQEAVLPITVIPAKISGPNKYIIAFSLMDADGINIAENFKSIVYTLKGNNAVVIPPIGPGIPIGPGLSLGARHSY